MNVGGMLSRVGLSAEASPSEILRALDEKKSLPGVDLDAIQKLEAHFRQLGGDPTSEFQPRVQAKTVDPVQIAETVTPKVVVRLATPEDAEAIGNIASRLSRDRMRAEGKDQSAGWLLYPVTQESAKEDMKKPDHDFLVAELGGKVVGYRHIIRGGIPVDLEEHHIFAKHEERVKRLVDGVEPYLWMSQCGVDDEHQRQGVGTALNRAVEERYDPELPLLCYVVIYTQEDFDRAGGDLKPSKLEEHNDASHRWHQKIGYEMVGYTSNVVGDPHSTCSQEYANFNSGALYAKFGRGGADNEIYRHPVAQVLRNPPIKAAAVD